MRIRTLTLAALSAVSLGAAACTQAEQDNAQADANQAAETTGEKAEDAGSAIKEEASQVGSAIAAGAGEAAQEVDEATDKLAQKADEQKAETQADTKGNQ
ncbi:hypothetical protein [Brevundimonas sp. Root1279]|uniref:hypothetical protein n=1 Tax=Brevundimonas sp. Root1279 TaxID=1736443 RepID=UPI0006F6C26D|nr:hypothetical protein [Brevundimonas sp. Root1279]KQW86722.1 hypothetical protein ASC65_02215 [Brevundimonas sp. Root1279]